MRLTQGIHRAVQLYASQPALLADSTTRTWRELADRVARLAAVFAGYGIEPGDRMAMLALPTSGAGKVLKNELREARGAGSGSSR